jgi:hypothetical protein
MSDPLDKDELEKLKDLELASYVPHYSNAALRACWEPFRARGYRTRHS